MRQSLLVIALVVSLGGLALAPAGPQDEVAAATQAWIEAVNSHDAGRVVTLYDPEAVLWGAQSPVLRDSPALIRDDFEILRTFPPWYKAVLGEQRIRVYGDLALNSGTYRFLGGARRPAHQLARAVQLGLLEAEWALADCGAPHIRGAAPAPIGGQRRSSTGDWLLCRSASTTARSARGIQIRIPMREPISARSACILIDSHASSGRALSDVVSRSVSSGPVTVTSVSAR